MRLCGWRPPGGSSTEEEEEEEEAGGGGEGDGEVAGGSMWAGGEGGESGLSSPDICIERKYLAAACLSCSLSSAVCRLEQQQISLPVSAPHNWYGAVRKEKIFL